MKAGDKVYWYWRDTRISKEMQSSPITKVGRKYLEVGRLRVDLRTMRFVDERGLQEQVHLSAEGCSVEKWVEDNSYSIAEQVKSCKDYDKLKAILTILGGAPEK